LLSPLKWIPYHYWLVVENTYPLYGEEKKKKRKKYKLLMWMKTPRWNCILVLLISWAGSIPRPMDGNYICLARRIDRPAAACPSCCPNEQQCARSARGHHLSPLSTAPSVLCCGDHRGRLFFCTDLVSLLPTEESVGYGAVFFFFFVLSHPFLVFFHNTL
jgi:hypothetical protein